MSESTKSSKPPFIQSVVHATDFSAADERAFAHALGVALLRQAELTILHVTSDASGDWRELPPADAERNLVAVADGNLTLANVLIPVDRTPDPGAAIEFARRAAEIMSDDKVTITLLHVGNEQGMPSVRAKDGARWTFASMHRDGDPVDEIVAAAKLVRADLIVMSTEGRHGVFDALRGGTTERVVRRARCPVLAVPAPRG